MANNLRPNRENRINIPIQEIIPGSVNPNPQLVNPLNPDEMRQLYGLNNNQRNNPPTGPQPIGGKRKATKKSRKATRKARKAKRKTRK